MQDDEGHSVSDTGVASVSAPPVVVPRVAIAARERKKFSGAVARFMSPAPAAAGVFSAQINWGDGSTSAGVVETSGSSARGTRFTIN